MGFKRLKSCIVSEEGLVQAVGSGKAVITAKTASGGLKASCNITVEQPHISITQTELSIYVTESQTLETVSLPIGQTVAWKSDNPKAATVKNGVVTAVASGTANIIASFMYNGTEVVSEKCAVNVLPPSIALEQNSVKLYVTDTKKLAADVHPANAVIRWVSSDPDIVTVKDGLLTAVARGTADITAKINIEGESYSAVCSVAVSEAVYIFGGEKYSRMLPTNQTIRDYANASASEEYNEKIKWKSSDLNAVSISYSGVDESGYSRVSIETRAAGMAVMTAEVKIDGKTYTDSITITLLRPGYYMNKKTAEIAIGEELELYVYNEYGATTNLCDWSISGDCVAVTKRGLVTGINEGKATVTAAVTDEITGKNIM